jgi:hypothetical protein
LFDGLYSLSNDSEFVFGINYLYRLIVKLFLYCKKLSAFFFSLILSEGEKGIWLRNELSLYLDVFLFKSTWRYLWDLSVFFYKLMSVAEI